MRCIQTRGHAGDLAFLSAVDHVERQPIATRSTSVPSLECHAALASDRIRMWITLAYLIENAASTPSTQSLCFLHPNTSIASRTGQHDCERVAVLQPASERQVLASRSPIHSHARVRVRRERNGPLRPLPPMPQHASGRDTRARSRYHTDRDLGMYSDRPQCSEPDRPINLCLLPIRQRDAGTRSPKSNSAP